MPVLGTAPIMRKTFSMARGSLVPVARLVQVTDRSRVSPSSAVSSVSVWSVIRGDARDADVLRRGAFLRSAVFAS